jgi:hypothetical protein
MLKLNLENIAKKIIFDLEKIRIGYNALVIKILKHFK